MRLHNQEINNLAVYTGVKTDALRKFIRKYNLDIARLERDVTKFKKARLDLSSAISGYEDNELFHEIKAKYSLDESRRANEFFETKHGKAIFSLLKRNGKVFNRDLVKQYLDKLNTNDLKWTRIMDYIASDLGLNYSEYNTSTEQEEAMLDVLETLYHQNQPKKDKLIVTKKTLNEMIDKFTKTDMEEIAERKALKRIVIDVVQFEALLNHVLNPINQSVTINEGVLDDTYTFEVYSNRMKKFLDFLKDLPRFRPVKMKKDGEYIYITVINNGRFIDWVPLVTFYKEHIKI